MTPGVFVPGGQAKLGDVAANQGITQELAAMMNEDHITLNDGSEQGAASFVAFSLWCPPPPSYTFPPAPIICGFPLPTEPSRLWPAARSKDSILEVRHQETGELVGRYGTDEDGKAFFYGPHAEVHPSPLPSLPLSLHTSIVRHIPCPLGQAVVSCTRGRGFNSLFSHSG